MPSVPTASPAELSDPPEADALAQVERLSIESSSEPSDLPSPSTLTQPVDLALRPFSFDEWIAWRDRGGSRIRGSRDPIGQTGPSDHQAPGGALDEAVPSSISTHSRPSRIPDLMADSISEVDGVGQAQSMLGMNCVTADALTPPQADRGRLSPLPQLPPDIVILIIQSSLLLPSSHHFDDGWHQSGVIILKTYALVCSTWKALAQRELFRWPVLCGLESIRAFLGDLEREPRLSAMVERLRIDGAEKGPQAWWTSMLLFDRQRRDRAPWEGSVKTETAGYIVAILAACPRVKEVWLRRVKGFQLVWLEHSKELEVLELHLVRCDRELTDNQHPSRGLTLPHLRSLSLNTVSRPSWLPDVMPPASLPRLSSFSFQNTPPKWLDYRCPPLSFLNRLDVLGLTLDDFPSHRLDLPPHLTVLWTRDLLSFGAIAAPTSQSPSHQIAIRHLRLQINQAGRRNIPEIIIGILNDNSALVSLEVLYLPLSITDVLLETEPSVFAECAGRGIRLVLEDIDGNGAFTTMSAECWIRGRDAKRGDRVEV